MDFIYMAGFAITAVIFGAFAITTDPNRHPILRNMFFLATLATLFLVVNMSVQTIKTGEWVVDTTTFDSLTNTTTYAYTQVAPSVNAPDLDNIFLILGSVLWLVFAYVFVQMLINVLDILSKLFGKKEED